MAAEALTADASAVPLAPGVGADPPLAAPRRASTATNVAANLAGRVWTVVLGVAVVPVYLHLLGVEGYALIGIFAVLQSVTTLLDFGLGTTINRQLALDASLGGRERHMRDFTRTVELLYWGGTVVLAAGWVALAPFIADRWVPPSGLAPSSVRTAVALMGVAAPLQFPFSLYAGGLLGLQRQVQYNAALIALGTLRSVGAVLVLRFVSPTVEAFFAWQAVASAVQSGVGATLLWRNLPAHPARPRPDLAQLAQVRHFVAGAGGVALIGALLAQADKVILSRLLPLAEFGYYTLAGVLGSSVYLLVQPLYMAYFPKLSELVARGDERRLAAAYHQASQFAAVVMLPAAAVAAAFSRQVIALWTHDPRAAASAWPAATVLIASNVAVGLYGLTYTLQLAHGWTRLGVWTTTVQLALGVPLIYLAAARFGAVGAAAAWVLINGAALVVVVAVMHRRLLPQSAARWWSVDVGAPAIASVAVALAARAALPPSLHGLPLLAYVALVSAVTLATAVCVTPSPRAVATKLIRRALARPAHGC